MFDNPQTCPEIYLLWFHHLPWNYKMKSGQTLWNELCYTYDLGVKEVRGFQTTWAKAEKYVDRERFGQVEAKLQIQAQDASWWKDACLLYFQQYSRLPIPIIIESPTHKLDELMKIKLNLVSHN